MKLAAPGTEIENPSSESGASVTWSATHALEDGASSSTWTVLIVSGMDVIFDKDNTGAVTRYVYANGMRIAKITPSGGVQYFLSDHQGSTRKVLDANRNTVFSTEYEPFGKPYATSGTHPDPHQHTMEKHDDPTGLVYLRARQYDPEIGRFVSADPVLGSLGNPQTLNRYAYVVNNPLKYTDPSGLLFLSPFLGRDCGTFLECEASFRAGADLTMLVMGFIPGAETIADAYFLFWSTVDLIRAPSWERAGMMGLDFASLMVPGVSFGTWARTGKLGANVLLPFLMGFVRRADNVPVGGADNLLRGIDQVPSNQLRHSFGTPQDFSRAYGPGRSVGTKGSLEWDITPDLKVRYDPGHAHTRPGPPAPRHVNPHYHVYYRGERITPLGYTRGEGTGFLAHETVLWGDALSLLF